MGLGFRVSGLGFRGYLTGVLTIRESYCLGGAVIGVPCFCKPPCGLLLISRSGRRVQRT